METISPEKYEKESPAEYVRIRFLFFSLGKVAGFPIEDMIPAIPMDHDFPWPSSDKAITLN